MNRIVGFVVVTLLCLHFSVAQKGIFFFGEVRDSTGAPLQFANVMAMDTTTKKMAGFAVTNTNGQFRIGLESGKSYLLKITFIGYAPFEKLIRPTETSDDPLVFILSNNGLRLDEIQVVADMPVVIRGDTITYAADAFTQGDERKLEDVLEDLPGFQIEEDGTIKVQGKTIDKVLIDGKEFFDGDTKLATKNIPANVVDKVQLLQNYNDISPLRSFGETDQMAINVQLKEDKKQIVFGDITGAAGPQERYLGHSNTFYYDKKTNLNLITDANNVGELAFTMSDYFRFAGGLSSLSRGRGSNFNVSSDQLGIPMAERKSAKSLNNTLGAFNYNFTPTKSWKIGGFLIGSTVDNSFGSFSRRTYLQETNSVNEQLLSNSNVETQSGLGKIKVDYAPNYNLHIGYELFGRTARIKNGANQFSEVNATTNSITSLQKQEPWALEQQLRMFYSLGEKDVLSLELGQEMQHQNPTFGMGTTIQPFQGTIPMVASSSYDLTQKRNIETVKLEALANYYRILNRTNHVNFSFGSTMSNQEYSSRLFQGLPSGDEEFTNTDFRNDATFKFNDTFIGMLFRNKVGKFTFTPEINLHHYDVSFSQLTGSDGFDKWMWLPGFKAKYEIRNSQTVNFSYSLDANFMDIQKVMTNLVVSNYNFLETGNPNLTNSLFHSFNLNYSNFNMYTFFNIYGGLNYQLKKDDIQNSFTLNNWERIGLPINILPVNQELNGYLNLEKRFDNFKLGADGNWAYSLVNNKLDQTANTNTNYRQVYKGTFSTRFWKKLGLRLTHEMTINQYMGSLNTSTFINKQSGIRTSWKPVAGLEWITTYSLNNYKGKSSAVKSQYDMLDLIIRYRKGKSPWEFSVEGLNVLDTRSIRRDSFTDNLISTYSYDIQQRYFLLKVMFDL